MDSTAYFAPTASQDGPAESFYTHDMDATQIWIGPALQKLREEKAMTRRQVAAMLDITEGSVFRHETGAREVKRVYLMAYLGAYTTTEEEFIKKFKPTV
jgi:hypothetical protein